MHTCFVASKMIIECAGSQTNFDLQELHELKMKILPFVTSLEYALLSIILSLLFEILFLLFEND